MALLTESTNISGEPTRCGARVNGLTHHMAHLGKLMHIWERPQNFRGRGMRERSQ